MFPYSLKFAMAKVLIEQGRSCAEIRARTGLAFGTIVKIRREEIKPNSQTVERLKRLEGDKLTLLSHRILDSVQYETIEDASLLQRATAVGIFLDKRELLEGKPTSRMEFSGFSDAELDSQIAKLQAGIGHEREKAKAIDAEVLPTQEP